MTDFAAARASMVYGQVRTNDVTDPLITAAMLEVPRERFVPSAMADVAYLDRDTPVGAAGAAASRYLLKPLMVAKLIQAASIKPGDRVLDVGCATGYTAALLAHLGASVVALEEDAELARVATTNLISLGLTQATVVTGPLRDGWPGSAPYDAILLEGRSERAPEQLLRQLAPGGKLVCVQGHASGAKGMAYRYVNGDASGWPLFDGAAPLLPGFAAPAAFVF